jgi:hypothetical protein
MSRYANTQPKEEWYLSDELYSHLPKWRKILRDLGTETGIWELINSSAAQDKKPTANPESAKLAQTEDEG